ncbi:MAG TPA: type I methionyl aminopeptidase [Thermomicrobiales bacterium]|nr:type I methionyl aminopeptidase [Thermomicrobiales bacterium]
MPVVLKSPSDLERMRAAGAVLASVHERLRGLVQPGITTRELDSVAYELITAAGGSPSFLNYRGYPASICASVNDEILHGIPGERQLQDGDILSLDLGVYLDGFHSDAAVTLPVGIVETRLLELIETAEECFWIGFRALKAGGRVGDAGSVIYELATSRGFGIVRDYAGHGVGRRMHEEPSVPNYGQPGSGSKLRVGMTFALEPMLTLGTHETRVLADNWTVVTADGSAAAHYEHTVAITEDGPEILTALTANVI